MRAIRTTSTDDDDGSDDDGDDDDGCGNDGERRHKGASEAFTSADPAFALAVA